MNIKVNFPKQVNVIFSLVDRDDHSNQLDQVSVDMPFRLMKGDVVCFEDNITYSQYVESGYLSASYEGVIQNDKTYQIVYIESEFHHCFEKEESELFQEAKIIEVIK